MKHVYGFQAGGMHPTGMLSCLLLRLFVLADTVESPGGSAAPVALPNLRNYCRHTSIGHSERRRADLFNWVFHLEPYSVRSGNVV